MDIQRQLKRLQSAELEKAKVEDYVFVERVRVIDALSILRLRFPKKSAEYGLKGSML